MTVYGISPKGAKLIGWGTLPVPFATLAVILRFVARRSSQKVGPDDWCMLVALMLYYGLYVILVIWAPVGKVGFPQKDLSYEQTTEFLKIFFCVQLFYAWVGPAIKMSFLLLYRRIFIIQWFMRITLIVAALVMIWCISVTVTVIVECQPVGSYWQPLRQEHCIDSQKFYWANGISNMLLDIIILCLPLRPIWKLQMSTRSKISLTGVFALGAFICIASILRITYLWFIVFDDVSGTIAIPSIWTSIEPGLGIVCGCLPTLPTLFRRWSEIYSSKFGNSGSMLLNLTNIRFLRSRRTKEDSQQTSLRENSTAYVRFDQDIEMVA